MPPFSLESLDNFCRAVEQLDRPAEVIEGFQVEGGVLGHKLHVVEHAGMAYDFNDGRPVAMDVSANRWQAVVQQLSKLVGSHDVYLAYLQIAADTRV